MPKTRTQQIKSGAVEARGRARPLLFKTYKAQKNLVYGLRVTLPYLSSTVVLMLCMGRHKTEMVNSGLMS